jgi:malonyl-CoA O-methyltransferase
MNIKFLTKEGKGGNDYILNYKNALKWFKNNTIPQKGIIISSKQRVPYPEVTGYTIPTLIDSGEYDLAEGYSEFLSSIQQPNGAFPGPDGREVIFDSGQALRGLVRASGRWERFRPIAKKTADYVVSQIKEDGRIPAPTGYGYGEVIPESIHIFILPALAEAAILLDSPEYLELAKKSVEYYKKDPNALSTSTLTHFLAYVIDGFIDMGEVKHIRPIVERIFSTQKSDGSIPAYSNVDWVCSTGLAQLSIIAYKLNMMQEGDRAMEYLCKIQNNSGGFYGSYGSGAKYFKDAEISWANKFFIDAVHMKMEAFRNSVKDTSK